MKRGEVRWYTFQEPDKRRPVLILTRSGIIPHLNSVTIAPITSTIRGIPSELALDQEDGMLGACAVNLDNIQTVSKGGIGDLIATLPLFRMDEVDAAIRFALGMKGG
jgi:mRNA interferase MazF